MANKETFSQKQRIVSLDQFRGYTVAGMFLVNFLGGYMGVPTILQHKNTFCSYADTIMPHFLFAVGFAYRLTFLRRLQRQSVRETYMQAVWRNLGLILVGLAVYGLDANYSSWAELSAMGLKGFLLTAFRDSPWQALVHIGVTGLWVLPVIARGTAVRLVFLALCAVANMFVLHTSYYSWTFAVSTNDGGPLGFLTWTLPLLMGSITYDIVAAHSARNAIRPILIWAVALMLLGYGLSCITTIKQAWAGVPGNSGILAWFVEPPFVPPSRPVDMWTMCQRTGSTSYQFFGAGFSMLVFAAFLYACDIKTLQVGFFRTFGQNALAAYLIHDVVGETVERSIPHDSPGTLIVLGLLVFFGVTYFFVRHLEKNNIFLRL